MAARPLTDYNGNTVSIAFTGDIPDGAEVSAKVTIGGVDYTKDVTLEQGTFKVDEDAEWIAESAASFESTGAWSGDQAEVSGGVIAVSNALFTAAKAAPEDAATGYVAKDVTGLQIKFGPHTTVAQYYSEIEAVESASPVAPVQGTVFTIE